MNKAGVTFRSAHAEDVPTLCRLYDDFYRYNSLQQPYFYAAAKETGQYPQSVISGTSGDLLVAETGNEIIGFLHIEEDGTPPYAALVQRRFACVVDFYVTPEYRKRGVGQALFEQAKAWAANRRLEYLELSVLEENELGKRFYRRQNFSSDSVVMRYRL